VEGGGFAKIGEFGQVAGAEEGHPEDCGGIGEAGWYRKSGLR